MAAVALLYLVAYHGKIAAAQARRELKAQRGGVDLVDLDGHYLLQLLDALLHLHCFGGLIAEPLDEATYVGYLALLVFVGTQLLFAPLGTQPHILVIAHTVVYHPAAGDLDCAVCHIIYKGTVVADEHYGLGTLHQELLQPLYTLDVEVVGWLVEEQHVGSLKEYLGQLYAHTPSAGELARGPLKVAAAKAQTAERALDLGFVVLASHHSVVLLQLCELLNKLQIVVALVVGALGKLPLHAVEALLQARGMSKSLTRFLKHCGVVGYLHHLRKISNGGLRGHCHHTIGGMLLTTEHLEHR